MSARGRRLAELERRIASVPVDVAEVRRAYDVFAETGELPEDERLAHGVVDRARYGAKVWDACNSGLDKPALLRRLLNEPPRQKDELMDSLHFEAVFGKGMERAAARHLLRHFAEMGLDPTRPLFAGRKVSLPEFGGVGLNLLGYPRRLARPPYMRQAVRLFRRLEALQARIPHDRRWPVRLRDAIHRFQEDGERPDDEVLLEAVLIAGELNTLQAHACGEEVGELMRAFAEAARTAGDERARAIDRVQALAVR